MKVVILGAKGLLGEALTAAFVGHDLHAYDRDELDVTDFGRLRDELAQVHPEVVLNCVAWNDVDGAETKYEVAELLNVRVPRELAKITRAQGAILVHYSTDNVFDGNNSSGYAEDAAPNPANAYGRSKYGGEIGVREEAEKYYLIRTSRLYGAKPSSPIAKPSFVVRMVELGRIKKEMSVVHEEPGAFTYAKDLAEATKRILDEQRPFGIYHRTAAGAVTWYECASEIFKYLNIEISLTPIGRKDFPRAARVPASSVLLTTKLPPMRDWRIALHEFLDTLRV